MANRIRHELMEEGGGIMVRGLDPPIGLVIRSPF